MSNTCILFTDSGKYLKSYDVIHVKSDAGKYVGVRNSVKYADDMSGATFYGNKRALIMVNKLTKAGFHVVAIKPLVKTKYWTVHVHREAHGVRNFHSVRVDARGYNVFELSDRLFDPDVHEPVRNCIYSSKEKALERAIYELELEHASVLSSYERIKHQLGLELATEKVADSGILD